MGRRASRMVKSGPNGMLVAAFSVALLALILLFTVPAKAQNTVSGTQYTSSKETAQADAAGKDDSQTAARAADTLADGRVQIIDSDDSDNTVNQVVISGVDCTVEEQGASIVVEDDDGTRVKLTDGGNVDISSSEGRIVAQGSLDGNLRGINPIAPGNDSNFGDPRSDEYTETGELVDSTDIMCGREAAPTDTADTTDTTDTDTTEDTANEDAGDGDAARAADDLQDLSCEELLVLFRAGGSSEQQYMDVSSLADADVQARIEVCLEQEIVQGTAAGEDLPDTGGVSLLGLAVLGVVSAAAGFSVIRAGRRER